MSDKKCPCIDCICIAICRHKSYPSLILGCETIYRMIFGITISITSKESCTKIVRDIRDNIKPTIWDINDTGTIIEPNRTWQVREIYGKHKKVSM